MTESNAALHVNVLAQRVGELGRGDGDHSVFAYTPGAALGQSVSLTMPARLESYKWERGVAPIFEMNLPEGALRAELQRRFGKAVRGFDDFALLSIVGPHQLGRVGIGHSQTSLPTTDVAHLLTHDGTEGLFEALVAQYGEYSGVSGVQPKVLIADGSGIDRVTHRSATHLIKAFVAHDFPELAANEYFCMRAALHAGLTVPKIELSEHGRFLLVERFDQDAKGYLGFEDFCVLNGWPSKAKYDGSYEGAARQIQAFVSPALLAGALESFFKIVALSAMVRNGDAHLKNFGVLYRDCAEDADVWLAPAYDIVTTTVYIKQDSMALLLGGSKAWPKHKTLVRFGRVACQLTEGRCNELLQQVAHGMEQAMDEMQLYLQEHGHFETIGTAMLDEWKTGMHRSLTA